MYEVRYTTSKSDAEPCDAGIAWDDRAKDDSRSPWFGVRGIGGPGTRAYEARKDQPAEWTQKRYLSGPDAAGDSAHYVYMGPVPEHVEAVLLRGLDRWAQR